MANLSKPTHVYVARGRWGHKIGAITKMADALTARSSKFTAFFSRAELEAHLVFAVWPVVAQLQNPKTD